MSAGWDVSPMSTAAICRTREAMVHVEDRGYQFADGVYEVCEVRGGALVDERRHLARLQRSLGELRIAHADGAGRAARRAARDRAAQPGARRHRLSAGHARRRAARPCLSRRRTTPPSLVVTARRTRSAQAMSARPRRASPSSPCRRTAGRGSTSRSVALLPNVLAKQAAREQGAREAWFVDRDGLVTEGVVHQCLDRHRRRRWSPASRPRHPARHHPHGAAARRSRRKG